MKEKEHNGIIAFWKFILCLLIIAFHAGYGYSSAEKLFTGGSIGVEFFFLVSGYLFCKKVLKYEGKDKDIFEDNLKSTWKSIKRFFPFVFILVITSVFFARFVLHFRIKLFD